MQWQMNEVALVCMGGSGVGLSTPILKKQKHHSCMSLWSQTGKKGAGVVPGVVDLLLVAVSEDSDSFLLLTASIFSIFSLSS